MTGTADKHAAKHAKRKIRDISPYDLTVKFSPEVLETLNRVVEAVRYSPHFDGEDGLFEDLKGFTEGSNIAMMVRLMKDIGEGVAAHTKATNDPAAKKAWQEFTMQLIDPPGTEAPFMLTERERGKGL